MDYAQAIEDIAEELDEFGEFVSTTGSYLARLFLKAAEEFYEEFVWDFRIGSTTITTTDGTTAYDVPSGFDGMLHEKRLSRAYAFDNHAVPIIPDGDSQKMYPISYNQATGQIQFEVNPGTSSYKFYYIKTLSGLSDLTAWPQKTAKVVIALTKAMALMNSEDTKDQGILFQNKYNSLLNKFRKDYRRARSQQSVRDPRNILGDQYYLGASTERDFR